MTQSQSDELRDRARRCRELAVGYDGAVGATLLELAEELESRAARIEAGDPEEAS